VESLPDEVETVEIPEFWGPRIGHNPHLMISAELGAQAKDLQLFRRFIYDSQY